MPKPDRFFSITSKVNLAIIGSLVIGVGAVTGFLSYRLSDQISSDTATRLNEESAIIYESIRVLMLSGRALAVEQFTQNMNTSLSGTRVEILRSDNTHAFRDNMTIETVNARLGEDLFATRTELPQLLAAHGYTAPDGPPLPTERMDLEGNTWTARSFRPLLNTPLCFMCHGTDHLVRGHVAIRTDVTESIDRRNRAILAGSASFLVITIGISLILTQFLRRLVIRPLKKIGEVCRSVIEGDFLQRVDATANDEVGALGETVNTMVHGLHERSELRKFVSSGTLENVLEDQSGKRVSLTILFSDVRGFTAFSEQHKPEVVVERLNHLLSIQTEIVIRCGGDVDKYVGDEVIALFSGPDATRRAARSGIEIQREVEGADVEENLHVGIGINSGEVILGMVGSERRADFTVIGDNVNLASRLCDVARRGEILISNVVRKELGLAATVEGPYGVSLKGKSQKQRVFKLRGLETGE